jgi:Protein of unknown function (DUF3300)
MTPKTCRLVKHRHSLLAVLCACVIGPGDAFAYAALLPRTAVPPAQAATAAPQDSAPIPADQLDSLVAPIALFPDPVLAQTLAASTYPLELMQLQQWLTKNPGLKEKALADAVAQQPWDPSVQAMAVLPDLVKRLTNDIQWTTDLGNAFLAQQSDVMNAVQRMRHKAQAKGTLKTTEQQVVQTETVQDKQVIVIEQASPQVVYVPSYDPAYVYGTPAYPYPPIYYPSAGYYAAGAAISFGVGVAMGAFWGGGGWGWNTGWGGNNININNNNNFNRISNTRAGAINNRSGTWQHNAAHRGGAPYANRATANRFGGAARGDSLANRQSAARQQLNRQGGQLGTSGLGNRGGVGDRGGVGNRGGVGDRGSSGIGGGRDGIGNRPGGGIGDRGSSGIGGGNRGTSGIGNRPGTLPSGGGADRIGSRDVSRGGGNSAFGGGGSRGFDGAGARASSNRGSSSFGGGGFNRGGGGGGFSRGGGGGGFSRGGGGGGARRGGGGGRRR